MSTKTVRINGVDHELPVAAADAILAERAATEKAAADQAAADRAAGERDAALAAKDAEIARLQAAIPTADQIAALATERAAIVADAQRIAPGLKVDGLGLPAIKRAAVAAHLGDKATALDGKSDDYVAARFDALVDAAPAGTDPIVDAVRGGVKPTADAATTARDAYLASLTKAHAA